MSGIIEKKLKELNITLPDAAPPAANYIPYVVSGNMVYISGQLPFLNGEKNFIGRLGENTSIEEAEKGARACGLNIIAQLRAACGGDLDKVVRCVKLGGFVNCTADFTDQPKVINGASNLMGDVFGEKGKHARFAVGAPSLPFGVAVEIDAVFEIS